MAHLARDTRDAQKVAVLRETQEEVPVLEEIERGVEAARIEKRVAPQQQRRERDVVVDLQQVAVEVLRVDAQPRARLVRAAGAGAEERRDRVRVPGRVP